MAFINFDATNIEPSSEYQPLPVGEYAVVITESNMQATKAGTGEYIKLKFEVIEGTFKGRTLFSNLNINNTNQTAVEIAMRDLSAICRAVNRMQITDTSQLHNQPLTVKVGLEPSNKGDGSFNNVIKAYSAYGKTLAAPVAQPQPMPQATQPSYQAPVQTAQANDANTPPWMK